jgi:hypothetical protein
MTRNIIVACFVIIVNLYGCTTGENFDTQKETQVITALLQQERKAHFEKNVDLFLSEFADNMISVNKGKVSVATEAENRERIAEYFGRVEFVKWDDVAVPVIRFSDDGSLCYAIVEKQVILSLPDSLGRRILDTTDFAWASIYRKQDGGWKVECNVSTNK